MSRLRSALADVAVIVAAICAIVVTVTVLRRDDGVLVPRRVKGWDRIAGEVRYWAGDTSAPVRLVVFSDFECPFCRKFAEQVAPRLLERFPGQLAIGFRHWPLEHHPSALPSARLAECAGSIGDFWSVHDRLFAEQDSLESAPGRILAGLPADRARAIDSCLAMADFSDIEADVSAALRLGNRGTPTVVLQGTLYPIADGRVLEAAIAGLVEAGD